MSDQRRLKPMAMTPLPSRLVIEYITKAWWDGYYSGLTRVETAIYQGMDAVKEVMDTRDTEKA
jgi:hypothetical protein